MVIKHAYIGMMYFGLGDLSKLWSQLFIFLLDRETFTGAINYVIIPTTKRNEFQ